MRNVMRKEAKLSASPLDYLFILFGLMFFLPGYPILCGVFFVTLGIFQGFQYAREANDLVFSALLPISKRDVVRGKYLFVCCIEGCALLLMLGATLTRMTLLADALPYRTNALMNANFFALGGALVIFGLFNAIFLGGYFRTAYALGKPFVIFTVAGFLTVTLFEALHHFPGLEPLNAFGFEHLGLQLGLLLAGAAVFALATGLSYRAACAHFERIDL